MVKVAQDWSDYCYLNTELEHYLALSDIQGWLIPRLLDYCVEEEGTSYLATEYIQVRHSL